MDNNMKNEKLEDITSKEYLDKSIENAKVWCSNNLEKHIRGFQNRINYNIFRYIIDNKMIGSDMRLDEKIPGLIRVSTRKLRWYQKRENFFKTRGRGAVEIDPESMFVHEIVEFISEKTPEILLHYFLKWESPHYIAYYIENINRRERGLKDWPKEYL